MEDKFWVVMQKRSDAWSATYDNESEAREFAKKLSVDRCADVYVLEVIGVARPSSVTYTEIV